MNKDALKIYIMCNLTMIVCIIIFNVLEGSSFTKIGLNLLFSEIFYAIYCVIINFIGKLIK